MTVGFMLSAIRALLMPVMLMMTNVEDAIGVGNDGGVSGLLQWLIFCSLWWRR